MNLHAILVRAPVNRLAASVVSQRRTAAEDEPMSRDELCYLLDRLQRKQRLLKRVLGIANATQHRNVMYRASRGFRQFRFEKEPRAFTEYRLLGQQMQGLIRGLAELKQQRREAWAAEHGADA